MITSKYLLQFGSLFVISTVGLLLGACSADSSSTQATIPAPSGPPVTSSSSLANQLAQATNQYRVSMGRKPLTRHTGLDSLALKQAQEMAARGKLRGSKSLQRDYLASTKYNIERLHENSVRGAGMSSNTWSSWIMNTWKTTSVTKQNLLSKSASHYGVGTAISADGYFNVVYLAGTQQ